MYECAETLEGRLIRTTKSLELEDQVSSTNTHANGHQSEFKLLVPRQSRIGLRRYLELRKGLDGCQIDRVLSGFTHQFNNTDTDTGNDED